MAFCLLSENLNFPTGQILEKPREVFVVDFSYAIPVRKFYPAFLNLIRYTANAATIIVAMLATIAIGTVASVFSAGEGVGTKDSEGCVAAVSATLSVGTGSELRSAVDTACVGSFCDAVVISEAVEAIVVSTGRDSANVVSVVDVVCCADVPAEVLTDIDVSAVVAVGYVAFV